MEGLSSENGLNVLLGVTGSVAALKLPLLVQELKNKFPNGINIKVMTTERALHFFSREEVSGLGAQVLGDREEWALWGCRGDPVLHVQLGAWAQLLLLAPLDANTLAKLAQGLCDNLVTCAVRAWPLHKPLLFCPAMNTHMWQHPVTSGQLSLLQSWGYRLVPPVAKTLVCGDHGMGAMAEVNTIVEQVQQVLKERQNSNS